MPAGSLPGTSQSHGAGGLGSIRPRHRLEIVEQPQVAWLPYLDWRTAEEAARLALHVWLAVPSVPTSRLFKALCYTSPNLAIRAREWSIRGKAKPALREGYPGSNT